MEMCWIFIVIYGEFMVILVLPGECGELSGVSLVSQA